MRLWPCRRLRRPFRRTPTRRAVSVTRRRQQLRWTSGGATPQPPQGTGVTRLLWPGAVRPMGACGSAKLMVSFAHRTELTSLTPTNCVGKVAESEVVCASHARKLAQARASAFL
eukprot:6910575-Pyramimonas_sp.AAC.1